MTENHHPLRMLVLDDNPDDRRLALRELERAFPGVQVDQVGRPEDYAEVEDGFGRFDLVITDYQMRWTTGLDVLRDIKAKAPEVPVIMFTATGTQEIAVEAMKAGLDDYVIKSPRHYVRLAVAARICLDRAEIRRRALRSETRLHSLLDALRVGVLRLSTEGELVDANRAFRAMLDGDAAHPVLVRLRELAATLARAGDTVEAEWSATDGGGQADGPQSLALSLARVKVNGHDAVDVLAYDLSSLRAAERSLLDLNRTLEDKVEQRTRQLQEANDVLEGFGLSISHDLREPLRTIQGYAHALDEDLAAGRLRECADHSRRIGIVAARLDDIVNSLFEFSKLSVAHVPLQAVDLADALQEAQALLAEDPAFSRAELSLPAQPLPQVLAHPGTLTQVLVNLLSNAAKFVAPGATPRIVLRCEPRDRHVCLSVQDNGIGIPADSQGRIFAPFERLHSAEHYPGSGVGLAIVRKGLERMDGRVGVDSRPGEGSTFWIELPAAA